MARIVACGNATDGSEGRGLVMKPVISNRNGHIMSVRPFICPFGAFVQTVSMI